MKFLICSYSTPLPPGAGRGMIDEGTERSQMIHHHHYIRAHRIGEICHVGPNTGLGKSGHSTSAVRTLPVVQAMLAEQGINLTTQRIHQIERAALRKMRSALEAM